MTVSSTTSRKTYLGDAVTTSFDTNPVAFFLTSDLLVYVVVTATGVATLLTENTHYTVSGGSGTTGTVSLAGGSSPYGALSALQTLVIVRAVPETQLVDFVNNEATDAEVAEDALDKLTMICQQLDASVGRAFALASTDVSGASTVIPTPSANKVIGWNSAGTALQNYAGSDISLTLVSTFISTLIDDVDAKTARQTLILDKHGADIASATTLNLDNATGDLVDVTGTTAITAITLAEGVEKTVRFTGALTLTNGASLVLPGGANITTVAGDMAVFRGYASSVVRCVGYSPITVTGTGSAVRAASPTFTGTLTATGLVDVSGASAGQIKFPATQNASSDANTFDDYKEATWTPADGSGASLSFSAIVATYTKKGREITVTATLTYPATASGANATISGLPIVASGNFVGVCWSSGAAVAPTVTDLSSGAAGFLLRKNDGTVVTNANLSNATVRLTMTYFV